MNYILTLESREAGLLADIANLEAQTTNTDEDDDAMRVFEAELPQVVGDGTSAKSPGTFLVEGKSMKISRYLKESFEGKAVKYETSRIGRNQGKLKSGTAVNEGRNLDVDVVWCEEQPVAVLVVSESGVTLALTVATSFKTAKKGKANEVTLEEFDAATTVATAKVLILRAAGPLSLKCEAGCGGGEIMKYHTRFAQPISAELNTSVNPPTWVFSISALDALTSLLAAKIDSVSHDSLPKARGNTLPYTGSNDDTAMFIVPGTESIGRAIGITDEKSITCGVPGCCAKIKSSLARHHAAYHILILKDAAKNPCGLCAVHSSSDGAGATTCQCWLRLKQPSKGQARTNCQVRGDDYM